jgi:hypothetical protein
MKEGRKIELYFKDNRIKKIELNFFFKIIILKFFI